MDESQSTIDEDANDTAPERATDYTFMSLVKRFPMLWDTKSNDYLNTELKNVKWNEIGQQFSMTAAKAKDHFGTLRSGYNRSVKRIKAWEAAPSGSAARTKPRPRPYKYAAELSFLDAVAELDQTSDNLPDDEDQESGQASGHSSIQDFDMAASQPRKKKKLAEAADSSFSALTTLLNSATDRIARVQPVQPPVSSPIDSQDEDYLSSMLIYKHLKNTPNCLDKELGRMKLVQDAFHLKCEILGKPTQQYPQQQPLQSYTYQPTPDQSQRYLPASSSFQQQRAFQPYAQPIVLSQQSWHDTPLIRSRSANDMIPPVAHQQQVQQQQQDIVLDSSSDRSYLNLS